MNNMFSKTAIWVVIALVLFMVFKQFDGRGITTGANSIAYSDFLDEVKAKHINDATIDEANRWLRERGIHSGPLEMLVEFDTNAGVKNGVRLYKGPREETVVGVDRERIWIDRSKSGNVMFHPKFSGVQSAPLKSPEKYAKLHLFIDACSLEVFVNDGQQVLTNLTFPSPDSRGIEFFGEIQRANIRALEVWPITSSGR